MQSIQFSRCYESISSQLTGPLDIFPAINSQYFKPSVTLRWALRVTHPTSYVQRCMILHQEAICNCDSHAIRTSNHRKTLQSHRNWDEMVAVSSHPSNIARSIPEIQLQQNITPAAISRTMCQLRTNAGCSIKLHAMLFYCWPRGTSAMSL